MSLAQARRTFFMPVDTGQRLCIFHAPQGRVRGRVLYIAPFAEEMNKARRMAALQARALSAEGFAVLQIDLLGCGDSSGDFGDASWTQWLADLEQAHAWLRQQASGPDWLWGLRAGCLLAAELAERLPDACNFLFWQAMPSGKNALQQFLRLKLAGDMLDGTSGGGAQALKNRLAAGESVEIAGYRLSPGLSAGLEASQLRPAARATRLEWLEVSTRDDASLSPVAVKTLEAWREAGYRTRGEVLRGPAFWQTTEIEDAPALIEASIRLLCEEASA